jgi:hypothetical protein
MPALNYQQSPRKRSGRSQVNFAGGGLPNLKNYIILSIMIELFAILVVLVLLVLSIMAIRVYEWRNDVLTGHYILRRDR